MSQDAFLNRTWNEVTDDELASDIVVSHISPWWHDRRRRNRTVLAVHPLRQDR